MARRIAQWTFILATFLVAPAFAQSDSPPPGGPPPEQPPPMQAPMQPPMGPGAQGGGAAIRAACGQDVARFCMGVQRGGGRIVQCLIARRGTLSPRCEAELASLAPGRAMPPPGSRPMPPPPDGMGPPPPGMGGPPPGMAPPPPTGMAPPPNSRAAFQASCGPDVRMFCAGVPRDDIRKCLGTHRSDLSHTCKMYLAETRAQRSASPPPPRPAAADMPPPAAAPPPPVPPSSSGNPPAPTSPANE